jgi:hypothetical protein
MRLTLSDGGSMILVGWMDASEKGGLLLPADLMGRDGSGMRI